MAGEKLFSDARWHEVLDGDISEDTLAPLTDEEQKKAIITFRQALLDRGFSKEELDKQLPIDE